ncbi:Zinc finger protein-like 1 [Hypsibius exemplaris]|uniref:Zinc finger protein-like 1 homolog n=1 Tax=Hypsibius exemplaris TaxID=2072580 RepID=A0A1W0WZG5_HYPEX|nr:Zinc finger protein-like 1 [Hypsibius exemplaris]
MGLCKCARKRMTNLFCFEHHVNVCEDCLVHDHSKCVIKSYLNWLEDSDYDPNCPLCQRPLVDGECARLACYHVFHWTCLNRHAGQLPANTAPAGYKCPTCAQGIFPKSNLATPVADALRKQLETVEWGQTGLNAHPSDDSNFSATGAAALNEGVSTPNSYVRESQRETTISFDPKRSPGAEILPERDTLRRTGDAQHGRRDNFIPGIDSDTSEVKYRRKPFGEWISRLIRAYVPRPSANDAKAGMRRLFIAVLVILVMLLTFGVFMTSVNRSTTYEDALPELEKIDANPIRIEGGSRDQ